MINGAKNRFSGSELVEQCRTMGKTNQGKTKQQGDAMELFYRSGMDIGGVQAAGPQNSLFTLSPLEYLKTHKHSFVHKKLFQCIAWAMP